MVPALGREVASRSAGVRGLSFSEGRSLVRQACRLLRFEPLESRRVLSIGASAAWDAGVERGPAEIAIADISSPNLVYSPPSYTSLPNGMPVLHSRPGAAAAIFLDFDGDTNPTTGSQVDPYDKDGAPNTFNAIEATDIAECWREVALYFAMFDVDVTTIQPDVSTTPTAWDAIGNNATGHSAVGAFPNRDGHRSAGNDTLNSSDIAHEIGHNFGLHHQSDYDGLGNQTDEYRHAADRLHGVRMGVNTEGFVHNWTSGRDGVDIRAASIRSRWNACESPERGG